MSLYESEIRSVLIFLRSIDCNLNMLEAKISFLKKNISSEEFSKIINGSEEINIGEFKYKIITINGSKIWCLKSQIEYEIYVKQNKKLNPLYQKLKMVNV